MAVTDRPSSFPLSIGQHLPVKLPILDRYLLSELIVPFLFGLGAFSSLGISIGVVFDLVRKVTEAGLPFHFALEILVLKLPEFLVMAFPMSVLLATLMAYSRLSNDSEIIALRSCGIGTYRLIVPGLILSLVVTGLTFIFNESLVPAANYRAEITLDQALGSKQNEGFQEKNIFYQQFTPIQNIDGSEENQLARIFYAKGFDGEQMKGVLILDFTRGEPQQILVAEAAEWNSVFSRWDLFNGTIYLVNTDGSYRSIVNFEEHQFKIPRAPLDLANRTRDYGEMNIVQAQSYLKLLSQTGDEKKIRKLKVRIQEKFSFPFICLVFGLVGSSLGILPNQRTNRATAFGVSVLIIFSYYMLSFFSSSLGVRGTLSPEISAWFPIALGLVCGGILAMRSAR
ncbi:MAG: LptF/LptG family permease [Prochlorotrichaceae cyanobacterium]|jgi:lipopolysaccharide export system permease protein